MTILNIIIKNVFWILAVVCIMLGSLAFSQFSSAHPGRTDSSGGHTCRTNCESWGLEYGEYHYHNGGGSSGVDHTQEYIQASTGGKNHANTVNLHYIESVATSNAQPKGYDDGHKNKGQASLYAGSSDDICDDTVVFSSTPTDYYRRTFQNYFTSECTAIYKSKYQSVYTIAYASGKQLYETEQASAKAEEKRVKDSQNTVWGWVVGISIVGGIIYFARKA